MTVTTNKKGNNESASIRRYMIIGERRKSNYWWTLTLFLGSCGFLLSGISSYFRTVGISNVENEMNLFQNVDFIKTLFGYQAPPNGAFGAFFDILKAPLAPIGQTLTQTTLEDQTGISFFPQGLLMCFYGSLGLLLSFYWLFLIFWNVGGGFNEFNRKEGKLRIFRWGYPGKNRRIDLSYSLKDVDAIKVELKQGLDPQRTIYLKLKGKREIPITGIGEPLTLKEIEKQASSLANFLQVSLEGL